MKAVAAACAFAWLVAAVSPAGAENVCELPHDVSPQQLLRRLSLDVRGQLPSIEEYEELDALGASPYDHLAEWTVSEAFRLSMRRYHEEMVWPNVSMTKLAGGTSQLEKGEDEPALHTSDSWRQRVWRGVADVNCDDFEETRFLPEKDPSRPLYRVDTSRVKFDSDGVRREGWRWVKPYWDPEHPVKVCAFDAQGTESVVVDGETLECGVTAAYADASCGCGRDLHWCYGPWEQTGLAVLEDLREQLGRQVDEVTVGGRPYTDLLLSTTAWENGRIAFYKRWLATNVNHEGGAWNIADLTEEIPDKAFTDATWVQVNRGPFHAGIVTLPAYLLRFQTNRGRANHFRINFMCERFIPPAELADNQGCSSVGTDLQKRCNCRYCHIILEPMASAFGGFAEGGTTLQLNNPTFPIVRPSCVPGAGKQPSHFCGRFYVTQPDEHNAGMLLSRQYADVHSDLGVALEGGPRRLAQRIIDRGDFAQCAVKRLFLQLLRREMHLTGEGPDESALLETLAADFTASNYDFPRLVRQIVSLPVYARAR
jgi:hypothetical protein